MLDVLLLNFASEVITSFRSLPCSFLNLIPHSFFRVDRVFTLASQLGCSPPPHLTHMGMDRVFIQLMPVAMLGGPLSSDATRRSIFGVIVLGGVPIGPVNPGEFWCLMLIL
jgi:hypothetical protein